MEVVVLPEDEQVAEVLQDGLIVGAVTRGLALHHQAPDVLGQTLSAVATHEKHEGGVEAADVLLSQGGHVYQIDQVLEIFHLLVELSHVLQ